MVKKTRDRIRVLDESNNFGNKENKRGKSKDEREEQEDSYWEEEGIVEAKEKIEYFLGLDISTAITGFSIIDSNKKIILMGHISLQDMDPEDLFEKTDVTVDAIISNIPAEIKISKVFVEAPAKVFKAGFSTADVIITLAKMNALVSYVVHKKMGVPVISVNVSRARSAIGYKINKKDKRPEKEKVREFVLANFKEIKCETRVLSKGINKGKVVPVDGAADEIDSFVICLGGFNSTSRML